MYDRGVGCINEPERMASTIKASMSGMGRNRMPRGIGEASRPPREAGSEYRRRDDDEGGEDEVVE